MMNNSVLTSTSVLRFIKLTHTIIWAFFAGCILAIPIFSWHDDYTTALALTAIVLIEVVVLVANHFVCPLTSVAARYTDDRRENFDIYLPRWLARYNKQIFGSIFIGALLLSVLRWIGRAV